MPTTASADTQPQGCSTVPAAKWNHLVRLERQLDGHSAHRTRRHKICTSEYLAFKRHVQKVRADCLRARGHAKASTYGWPDSGGNIGACGRRLTDSLFTFAVLQTGDLWGAHILSRDWLDKYCFRHLYISLNGITIRAVMYDTGYGGPENPDIDLFNRTGTALHATGMDDVRISTRNCQAR